MATKQPKWKSFPASDEDFDYPAPALEKHWPRLHQGDCEPFPDGAYVKKMFETYPELKIKVPPAEAAETLQEAWRAYHRGDFQKAVELGLGLGRLGYNVANKAANIYATYLEEDKERQLALFLDAVHRGEVVQQSAAGQANAWYFHAQALGRYSQGISVAKALAEGHGGKIKDSLERAVKIEPKHADAHIALGAYHANVVNKMGGLAARLTFGASKEAAVENFQAAMKLHPDSAIARIEYANGLAMLFGKAKLAEATKLYEEAAECEPADAMEWFDVELAKSEIAA
jgi:tetratricopeptide (TPR) repeat protein